MSVLDLMIPRLADTLGVVRRAMTAEYAAVPDLQERGIVLDAFRPDNLLHPLSTVVGYVQQQLYVLFRERASQATPFGATGTNLDEWLAFFGVAVPTEATATGTVQITGRNSASIPAGTELLRLADGAIYTTDAIVSFGASESTETVAVTAEDTGSSYNAAAGEVLELALISDDIDPDVMVVSIEGGADPADEAAKVALMSARLRQSRTAKSAADYLRITLESTAAVLDVFVVEAGRGPGTVPIWPIMRLPEGSEDWEVLPPTAGEVSSIQSYVEARRGVNDRISIETITLTAVGLSIALTPNTAEVQAAVLDALRARFAESYDAEAYTIPNSEIIGAISAADGEISHTLIDVGGNGPDADVESPLGEMAQVGTIAWSDE